MVRAWQFFRAIGKIGGVNAVVNRIVGHGNSHRRGLPEFIATPNGNANQEVIMVPFLTCNYC